MIELEKHFLCCYFFIHLFNLKTLTVRNPPLRQKETFSASILHHNTLHKSLSAVERSQMQSTGVYLKAVALQTSPQPPVYPAFHSPLQMQMNYSPVDAGRITNFILGLKGWGSYYFSSACANPQTIKRCQETLRLLVWCEEPKKNRPARRISPFPSTRVIDACQECYTTVIFNNTTSACEMAGDGCMYSSVTCCACSCRTYSYEPNMNMH